MEVIMAMKCPKCYEKSAHQGQHTKSTQPYAATAYYKCFHCNTRFTLHKFLGDVSPDSTEDNRIDIIQSILSLSPEKLALLQDSLGT